MRFLCVTRLIVSNTNVSFLGPYGAAQFTHLGPCPLVWRVSAHDVGGTTGEASGVDDIPSVPLRLMIGFLGK